MSTHRNTILVASHVIPYPPAHGIYLRILKLLKWLHGEGYRVILVMPADSIDANALAELRKVTFDEASPSETSPSNSNGDAISIFKKDALGTAKAIT